MAATSSRNRCQTIPEDLVFEILSRLPVLSLLRFKSVCRSWCSLIESSDFISRHLQLSNLESNQENKLVIFNSHDQRNPYYSLTANFISYNNLQLHQSVEFVPVSDSRDKSNEMLIASCNGIICFKYKTWKVSYGWFDVISLWNPATKQITILPPPPSDIKVGGNLHINYGFGFDVKTNDYKVVRLGVVPLKILTRNRQFVEVYSLRTDSWRIIDAFPPLEIFVVSNPSKPFRNEIYCWMGYDRDSQACVILSFNFSNEAFGIIPVPGVYTNNSDCIMSLDILREKIACIAEDRNNGCKIWVLDEYGIKESWTNLYTISLNRVNTPLRFSIDGKILLWKREVKQLCLYDPPTKEVKDIPSPTLRYIFEAAVYKESLVSVRSAKWCN